MPIPDNRIRFPGPKIDLATDVGITSQDHDEYPAPGSQARADWMNLYLIGLLSQQSSYDEPVERRDGTPWFDLNTLSLKIWRDNEWQSYAEAIAVADDGEGNTTSLADWFAAVNDSLGSVGSEIVFSGIATADFITSITIPESLRDKLFSNSKPIVYINGLLINPRSAVIDAGVSVKLSGGITLSSDDEFVVFIRRIPNSTFYASNVVIP